MDELETMIVAADAILTKTRETVEALTVSALQQPRAMSHRAETTAESFLPSSQGNDSDYQRASSQESESVRGGVRG